MQPFSPSAGPAVAPAIASTSLPATATDPGRSLPGSSSLGGSSPLGGSRAVPVQPLSFTACKEQQLVLLLVRQLASAQFELAHAAMTQRLWDEVAALEIDPERVIQLLYGGHDLNDRGQLQDLDNLWLDQHRPRGGAWIRRLTPAAWRRGAPPAAPRAHR